MFVYTTTSSPALYPLSYYMVEATVPTPRERYLRAMAEAQSARARYLSELEERRILASLQQQGELLRADFPHSHMFSSRNDIAPRPVGHVYVEDLYRPVASHLGRRQLFVRQQKERFFSAHEPQNTLGNLEEIISALFRDGRDEECITERENERVRVEKPGTVNVPDARDYFIRRLERAVEGTHGDHYTHASHPLKPSSKAPIADPSRVPLSRKTEIPHSLLTRERAARAIQQGWRSHSADALARNDAVATIATLRARFQFLKDTFSFPEHLEFREHITDQEQEIPTLLFTQANAAVHAYSHELTKLLTLADAVPSHGSHRVREERRSFVRRVEAALDAVDQSVAKVWGNRNKGSAIAHSGMDALETPKAASTNVVPISGESVVHSSELDVSVLKKDPTTSDSEPLASSSTDASAIIHSHATDVDPSTLNNIQTEVPSQDMTFSDVPLEHKAQDCLPAPEGARDIRRDVATTDSTREDRDVAVQAKPETADTLPATKNLNVANFSSSNSTLSQSQSSVTVRMDAVENTEDIAIDVFPTSNGIDLTFGSPVPGLTTVQSFDVVYPDSPLSSPLAVANDVDPSELTQGPSAHVDADGTPTLPEAGNEARNNSKRKLEDEEAFELL